MLVKLLTTTPSISSGLTDKRQRRTEKGEEGGRGDEKGKKGVEFHPQKINPPPMLDHLTLLRHKGMHTLLSDSQRQRLSHSK